MAVPSPRLVHALRRTAIRLRDVDVTYRWSHFAHCNCGHLARTMTELAPEVIYRAAFAQPGDWAAQANDHEALDHEALDHGDRPALDEGAYEPSDRPRCTATGARMSDILDTMLSFGLERADIAHLERLSDSEILRHLGKNTTGLAHGDRNDVIAYLEAWADLLETRLPVEASAATYAAYAIAAE